MNSDPHQRANAIRACCDELRSEIVQLRRAFHQHPELSWREFKTSERISEILFAEGLNVRPGICRTGLVADIGDRATGKTVAIRADLDGLPISDTKAVEYASKVEGVMHACGHDAHIAMAIGVAKVLKRLDLVFPGCVRLIFQPSEEATPSGARELVKANVLDGVESIFAFHVDPELEVGRIGLRAGVLTAYCSEFRLSLFGKSGHAARPQHAVDAIYLSNQVIGALYDLVPNSNHSSIPAVLSIGKVAGGTKANIIPDHVEIAGTLRTIDEKSRREIISSMEKRVDAITKMLGGRHELEFLEPVPSVVNDLKLINLVHDVTAEFFGEDRVFAIENVSMGGEDFAWFLTAVPGALIRLGAREPGKEIRYLHTNNFDVDEDALVFGVALMTTLVIHYLSTSH